MNSKKRRLVGILTLSAVGAYLAVLNWFAEPKPSAAQTEFDPPKYSIVFVVDSSNTMFPPYGPNYFDLALDGIWGFCFATGYWFFRGTTRLE